MRSLFVLLLLFLWGQGYAEQIFLIYDGACGARLRYDRTVDGSARMDYYSYSLPAGFGMRLILETDGEGAAVQSQLPQDYLPCSEARLTADLAHRINEAQDHLFLVQPLPEGGYRVEPVVMAAVLEEMGSNIRYQSPFASFAFDTENSVIGVNLDGGNNGATVTFEGMEGSGCQATYLLRQTQPGAAFPAILYRLVPGLGIVERQFTGDGRVNHDEVISAAGVNDVSLDQYLEQQCRDRERQTAFVPLYIDAQPVAAANVPAEPVLQEGSAAPKMVATQVTEQNSVPSAVPVTVHEVAPGETLYAISRRYGVSVDEIKRANGLYDNTIFVGQRLKIGSENDAAYTGGGSTTVAPPRIRVPESTPPPADPVVSVPEVVVPPPARTRPAESNESGYHIVQPGETFASLALRYGYTTQRFKDFNNLSDAPVARVGQRLKTSDCDCPEAAPTQSPTGSGNNAAGITPRPSDYVPVAPAPARDRNNSSYTTAYPPPPVVAPSPNVIVPPARPVAESRPQSAAPAYESPVPPAYGAPVQQDRSFHIVQEGDSLYGIARQYRITVEELRSLNALETADVIVPYQKLYVN
ncbi:LysM repeat protein [Lewinella marina]|uniref:LysM domain-containing protein n=1 Tax=Neolewinella marina TaxID=438751 RepID=A0A2G0CFM5_9BACT|nr:LysM peptidoglycan-binding domain-containing protein [Neolewinella marina]NJB85598.1 LysM repeat protein [Neolewinella marina]PHK98717.1 hypothetical protein CGL56_09630 [Neolewinella marina]